jgi:glycosyltransferase involved in cell wall biosynthesis
MKISVLIPVYNEAKTILEIIKRVEAIGLAEEIIVVDDGSTDGTTEILKQVSEKEYRIIFKENNAGKGSAIKEGLKLVTGDIVIIQDADLEYNPKDYPVLIEPIISGRADIVYGSRWLSRGLSKMPLNMFKFGRWGLTALTNFLYGIRITDEPCGYKVFKTKIIKNINLRCNGFEFCPEITAKAVRSGYKIHEVAISYSPRTVSEGKKITYLDGLKAIITLFKYRFWNNA